MKPTRRQAATLAVLAATPACSRDAFAQAASPPCPSQPGDVVGLVLEGTGAPAGTVTVFGQAFRQGDLPRDASAGARLPNGGPLVVQADVKTRHPDGSARYAVMAIACPALSQGARQAVMLTRTGRATGQLDPGPIIGRHRAELRIEDRPIDLLALFRAALADRSTRPWQAGPLAVQARVTQPMPIYGMNSMRLVADLAVRSDGSLWAEVWLRNDGAMRPGGGSVAYPLRVTLDGQDVLQAMIARQHHYTGWGRLLFNSMPPPLVRPDAGYLADIGAVPRFDPATGVESSLLSSMGSAVLSQDWQIPLGPRQITQYMPMGGGRPDIGPVTRPQAIWLMTGDVRAAAHACGQAEASGSIPWHFWDGAWMDTRRWPRLWTDGRGGPPPGGLLQPIPNDTGWDLDSAHQPDLSTVPYLLTGRRAFLDEMQAQASWTVIGTWTGARGTPDRPGLAEGVNVVRGAQVRGAAWSLRQIDNAAWLTPDDDPMAPWLRATSEANWAWIRSQIPRWTDAQGEARGWIPGEYGTPGMVPPWQQDYFAFTAATAKLRGNEDAGHVLTWMSNFLAGRFLSERNGFTPNDGAAYLLVMNADSQARAPLRSWREIGQATRGQGMSNGSGWARSQGDYGQLALASLAMLIDATDSRDARTAWHWLRNAGAPFTSQADYRRDPQFNIVPRSEVRSACR